ncbi:RNAase [Clostridioides difficile]|nr:RNAase [Clostridioides difficile]
MIARQTGRARMKIGLSVAVVLSGGAMAQRFTANLGITGLSPPRVHIAGEVWHLDVGSAHPGAVVGPQGWAVRPLKWDASWVQNVVRPFFPYSSQA